MNQQEVLMQLSMLQQQAEKIEEQIKLVNQQILEIETLKTALDEIDKNGKDILANMGKGVFLKAEVKDKDLLVNIGNDIVVKKSPQETKEIIEKQIEQLSEFKQQFMLQLQETHMQLQDLVMHAREGQEHEHSHEETSN